MDPRRRQAMSRGDYHAQVLFDKMDNLEQKFMRITDTVEMIFNMLSSFKVEAKADFTAVKYETTKLKSMENEIKSEILELNKKIVKNSKTKIDFNKKISARKFAFYEAHRSEAIATIYENALRDDTPRVPRKLFKNPVDQQHQQVNELRKEQCLKQVEYEIKRLKLIAEIKTKLVEQIDCEMTEYFEEQYDMEEAEQHKNQWTELIKNEEERSCMIWSEKQGFFGSNKHLIPITAERKNSSKTSYKNDSARTKHTTNRRNYFDGNMMNNKMNDLRSDRRDYNWRSFKQK